MKSMVIVADSSFVIETIRQALRRSAGFNVIGKLDGYEPIGPALGGARPDIVLVDDMQNDDHALERIRECREEAREATILVLTMKMDEGWVAQALSCGATACISKSTHLPSLGNLIREIANGNVVTGSPPALSTAGITPPGTEELTARELEILELASQGLTNGQIGKELWVTQQTVKFHLSNVYRKLGVSNRTEASRYANLAPVHELRPLRAAGAA